MKKSIILGAMAFFAINIVGIQNANAQVNKQREQMLQATLDTSAPSEQTKTPTKIKKIQKVNSVNKQREQMLQAANETEQLDLISKLYIKEDTIYLERKKTIEQADKSLKKKKILVKQVKKTKE